MQYQESQLEKSSAKGTEGMKLWSGSILFFPYTDKLIRDFRDERVF